MNIDRDKRLEIDGVWIATGAKQCPSDEEALQGDGGRHITLVRVDGPRKEQER